jgi:hypothetical protein
MCRKGITPVTRESIEQRFADSYIPEPNSGCFLWIKSVDAYGYGDFLISKIPLGDGKRKRERIKAHRLSWQLHRGEIPEGMWVLHKCDVTGCVNPDHLFIGMPADNSADMVRKERQARGEDFDRKLTEQDVREIRASTDTHEALAARYGVNQATIGEIRNRQIWKHVGGGEDYDGRLRQGLPGEKNASAKLRADDVLAIRAQLATGARLVDLGREYGVSAELIGAIKARRIWRHLP